MSAMAQAQRRPPAEPSAAAAFWLAFWPFALALLLTMALPLSGAPRSTWSRREILDAIRMVESGGRSAPPDGDQGLAIGPYQIHLVYWLDAKGGDPGLGGSYEDCRDLGYAEQVVAAYMQRHAKAAWTAGRAETIARVHNGGPRGADSPATLRYWRRVRAHLPQ